MIDAADILVKLFLPIVKRKRLSCASAALQKGAAAKLPLSLNLS